MHNGDATHAGSRASERRRTGRGGWESYARNGRVPGAEDCPEPNRAVRKDKMHAQRGEGKVCCNLMSSRLSVQTAFENAGGNATVGAGRYG